MKFLKFYIDTDTINQKIPGYVKDIRFAKAEINQDFNEIEITCIIEPDYGEEWLGFDNAENCTRGKLELK